ncbi:unnamed protein product [Fusarium graminearum]|nr:unnamed protein product [Fusarium graminearum]
MADQHEVDLDSIIDRLLEVRGSRPGKQVQLLEAEIRYLCTKAREIFISQPILLELEAPIKYYDLLRLFEYGGFPPEANYLFLGDYVDRGKQSLETICLLLAYKIKYPENFFILRGNHECASINRIYGFYDECKRRYNIKLFLTAVFSVIFCGLIPIRILLDGVKTIEVFLLLSVLMLSRVSSRNMIWILFAELTRLLRMATNSSPSASWLHYSVRPTTVVNSTMLVL